MRFVSTRLRRTSILVLASSLLFVTAGPSTASESDPLSWAGDIAAVVHAATASADQSVPISQPAPSSGGGFSAEPANNQLVNLPADPASGISVASADAELMGLGLPVGEAHRDAEVAPDGTVVYSDRTGDVDVAAQSLDDGSVRVHTVIGRADAPVEYSYPLSLPEGLRPVLNQDGGVDFVADPESDSAGSDALRAIQGRIEPPWARDSNGAAVETHYELSGSTLLQVVDHRVEGVAYPVTADPWWNPFSWSWSSLGRATLGGLKRCGLGVVTGGGTTLASNVAVNVVRNAAGKYLVSVYGGPYGLVGVATASCITGIMG
jgi:hypothetical protein